MDPILRRKMNTKKDKENTEPATGGSKSTTQPALNRNAGLEADGLAKAGKKNETATRGATKTLTEQQKEPRAGPAVQPSNEKRQTISQAFLSQQAVQQKKLVAEVAKPHAAGPPKSIPGTYKGRVVQSKVSSLWKPAGGDSQAAAKVPAKPGATRAGIPRSGNLTRGRAMSAAAAAPSKPQAQKIALPPRSKSAPCKPPQPPANKNTGKAIRKPTAPKPQRPAPSLESVPKGLAAGALVRPGPSKAPGLESVPKGPRPGPSKAPGLESVPKGPRPGPSKAPGLESVPKGPRPGPSKAPAPLRRKEPVLSVKPRPLGAAAAEKRAAKPPAASTASQYRVTMETVEERRAKLSVWLTAKGRTLKRPAASAISRTASKPQPKPRAHSRPQAVAGKQDSNLQPRPEAQPGSDLTPSGESASDLRSEPERMASPQPDLLSTALDSLENSDLEPPEDPEVRMEDLVINLCSALETMEVGSASDANAADGVNRETEVKGDEGDREEEESEEELEGASVVRYSVRTTPYLQSVKRRIQQDATPGSAPRRHNTIKDLKFLTPVRRSCRIQRQSARLPALLAEHDPCVASLAELAQLDGDVGDVSAYIYRPNPALLNDVAQQPSEAGLRAGANQSPALV